MRALVIDHDDVCRRTAGGILTDMGWAVTLAASGQSGWQQAQSMPYELVVCELIMPDQDGFETMRLLRMLAYPCWVIAVSDGGLLGFKQYLSMARMLGADRVLAKPFERCELETAVAELVGEAGHSAA